MKPSLQPGVSMVKRIVVDRDRTIGFMGDDGRVYATPRLVSDVEYTCRDLILQHTDPGEDSVGTEVMLKHQAAALLGSTVEVSVRVVSVDGRKVVFAASVRDEIDEISSGTHSRFVVDVTRTTERLKAKAAKLAALPR